MAERVTLADLVTSDQHLSTAVIWCGEKFGPPYMGVPNQPSWGCRRKAGHDGPHACQASFEANWHVDIDLQDPEAVRRWLSA